MSLTPLYSTTPPRIDFPVSLRPLFDEHGTEIPKTKVVARTDTTPMVHFGVVSSRYRLIKHQDMETAIQPLMNRVGANIYTRSPILEKNGARLLIRYDFSSINYVVHEDIVSLRAYGINSYNGTTPMTIRVGAMISNREDGLLTGATAFNGVFDLSIRHVGADEDIELPSPELLIRAFQQTGDVWRSWSLQEVLQGHLELFLQEAKKLGLLTDRIIKKESARFESSGTWWDIYTLMTDIINHGSKRLQESTKLLRLDRLNLLMNHVILS
jgi:hypothetical protein